MQVVNMSASIQSQSSTRSAQSSSRDGTGGINQPSDVCGSKSGMSLKWLSGRDHLEPPGAPSFLHLLLATLFHNASDLVSAPSIWIL